MRDGEKAQLMKIRTKSEKMKEKKTIIKGYGFHEK